MSVENLRRKKNLRPARHFTGRIRGWRLAFDLPGLPFLEPAFACVRPGADDEVHGLAFEIPSDEAEGLDRQEGGYDVVPVPFEAYDGTVIDAIGLYVPKAGRGRPGAALRPSLRYLRLLRRGAREAALDREYLRRLDAIEPYVTPPQIRAQTRASIADFESDPDRRDAVWTAETLGQFTGTEDRRPAHTASLGYVVRVEAAFRSWRGHTITRRNLLHFRGESVDRNDLRFGDEGFAPLPRVADCSSEEIEFLHQNLDHLIQRGGVIVGRLREFLDAQ
jgi:hypothetical protein